jgi:hypothetical protein
MNKNPEQILFFNNSFKFENIASFQESYIKPNHNLLLLAFTI